MRDRNSVLSIYFYPFCVFHVADFFIICDRAKSSLPVKKQFFITRVLTRGPRPLLFMNLFFEVFVQYQGLWFCSLLLEGYNIQASHKRLCWMLIVSEKSLEEWKIKARIFENAKYQEGYSMILWRFPQRKKKLKEFVLNIYFYNWYRIVKYDSVVMLASSMYVS